MPTAEDVLYWSADRIRTLRALTGLTQKEFAQLIGVNISTVRAWEQGYRIPTKMKILSNLYAAERGLRPDAMRLPSKRRSNRRCHHHWQVNRATGNHTHAYFLCPLCSGEHTLVLKGGSYK